MLGEVWSNCPWAQMILALSAAFRSKRFWLLRSARCAYVNVTHATTRKMKIPFSRSAIFEVAANAAPRDVLFSKSGWKKASVISAACTRLMTICAARERWQKQLSPMIRRLINNYVALDAAAAGPFLNLPTPRAADKLRWAARRRRRVLRAHSKSANVREDSWAHSPNLEIHLLEKCVLESETEKTANDCKFHACILLETCFWY